VAPGFSSYNKADRFVNPNATSSANSEVIGPITHFSLDSAFGVTYNLGKRVALSVSVSDASLIHGDEYQATLAPIPCVPPHDICLPDGGAVIQHGYLEDDTLVHVGLERSFGRAFDDGGAELRNEAGLRNQVLFSWVNQPQVYLSTQYLVASNGFGGDVVHSLRSWLDVDSTMLFLPGGDAASYQDGGSKTEGFLGLKLGVRRPYYGVFAKVRPGFVSSSDVVTQESATPPPYTRNINFALDTGAVIEIYPRAGHFVMRLDMGEVASHYSAVKVATPSGAMTQPSQGGLAGLYGFGVGWRF